VTGAVGLPQMGAPHPFKAEEAVSAVTRLAAISPPIRTIAATAATMSDRVLLRPARVALIDPINLLCKRFHLRMLPGPLSRQAEQLFT
jgi:hypothetical protein